MTLATSLILLFSFFGILDTVYLSYHTITKKPVACFFFPAEWCMKVQYSKQSRTLGIPNSFAGFAFYLAIFVLTILFLQGSVTFLPIQIIIGVGFLFALYFTVVQAFVLHAFCTWCVVSAINFLVLALAAFVL